MNTRARGWTGRGKDRRASARGRQGKTPGEVPGAFHSPRWRKKHPRAAKPPEVLPLPGPRPPAYLRAWLCTRVLSGGRPPHVPGSPGAGLGGGLARPPRRAPLASSPSWRGGGAESGVGGARRGRGSPPLPPLRVRAGRGSARPPGLARGLSLPAGPRGWGLQAGGCGPGWRRGLAGRCFRGSRTPPPSLPLPSAPSSLPPASPSFPAGARCHDDAAAGPPRLGPGVFCVFFPLSRSFSSFFPFFLSEFCSPVGGTKRRKCWPLAGNSPLTEKEREMGEGREVTWKRGKKKVFFWSFWE